MKQGSDLSRKVQEMLKVCQEEIVRTTEIGKRMLSASKKNSDIHDSYERLGELLANAIRNKEHEWNHPIVHQLIKKIDDCEKSLEDIESDVNKIRFSDSENSDEEKE
jgi:predicted SprT family Zn-dependent metalloprotease